MIDSLKDLEKLFKLCRKQGISELSLNGTIIKFGELPLTHSVTSQDEETAEDPYADFPDGPLSNEELTFWANGGLPEDNPFRRDQ